MSDTQIQIIKDVIKMTPKLSLKTLTIIRDLMESMIDSKLIRLEPSVKLENMDITEKVMYLEYLTESKETKEEEERNALSLEEILKREGLQEESVRYMNVDVVEEYVGRDIDEILDEIDKEIANPNTKYYTHDEVFSSIRRRLNGQ